MRRHIKTLQEKYRNLRRWERITLILLIVAIVAIAVLITQKPKSPFLITDEGTQKEVVLKSVAELSLDKEPLDLIGIVQSESQVDIKTESSGSITRVLAQLGQKVARRQVLAEIENGTQRASVAQAEALVSTQEAQLKSLEESVANSGDTVAVKNARRTLYSSSLVAEPKDENSTLAPPLISGLYTGSVEGIYDLRIVHGRQVDDYEFFLKGIELIRTTEITNNELISTALGTHGLKVSFPGDIVDYLDTRWIIKIPNTESALYPANLSVYNSALDAQRGLNDQITAQRAQVASAKSTLDVAKAGLEKTIIRSPISGTLNKLDVELGDFVSIFQSVAEVANENQLEIKTYITEDDKKSLEVGLPAMVAGKYEGIVTSVAPAVDPATKKIEVSISVGEEEDLLNGQSVSVSIERRDVVSEELDQIFIPLSALKVTAEGVVVFSVNEIGVVEKHIVEEGPLTGEKVLILSGLTPQMRIITDVRGINVGDTVTIVQ